MYLLHDHQTIMAFPFQVRVLATDVGEARIKEVHGGRMHMFLFQIVQLHGVLILQLLG